jgi:hypothetical protein
MKPDLTNVRPLTPAQLRERRHLREQGKKPPKRPKPLTPNKRGRPKKNKRTVVASISIIPELKHRAEWEIGQGNFSLAVQRALTQALIEIDRARGKTKRPPSIGYKVDDE